MATKFTEIYNRAIFKFTDQKLLELHFEVRDEILEKFLISAKTDFQNYCRVNLDDYDLELKQFNQDLDDEIQEILALGVAFYWASHKTINSELLKNVLNSKDYYYYSPANLLKEVQTLRSTLYQEFHSKMRRYTYGSMDLGSLKP